MGLIDEFIAFLQEYKVITIAIGFIMGAAANDMVNSFVNNIFMPFLDPLIPGGTWETATLQFSGITLNWGAFVASVVNFIILAVAVFFIIVKLLAPALEGSE